MSAAAAAARHLLHRRLQNSRARSGRRDRPPSRRSAPARNGKRSAISRVVTPLSTRIVSIPASRPETMSVSMRSPIIAERLRVRLDRVQRRAHHQRVRLADVVRLDAGRAADQRRDRARRRQRPVGARAGRVGVGRDEARALADQPDRPRDPLERVRAGLAEHDVVRRAVVQRVAGVVQRGRQARLADHVRGAARALVVQEAGGRERRGPDRLLGQLAGRSPRAARRGRAACRSSCSSAPGTGSPARAGASRKRSAPGIACSSRTSTPSMSISHERISLACRSKARQA